MKNSLLRKLWEYFRRQQYEHVIKSAELFMKEHSKPDAEFFKVLALTYDQSALLSKSKKQRSERQQKAKAYFRAMLRYPSCLSSAYQGLGLVALHQGRLKEALRFYIKAHRIDSKNDSLIISLGNVYKALGKYETAIKWYRKGLADPEGVLPALINIALMYGKMGKRVLARRYAKKALEIMGKKKQDKGFETLKQMIKKYAETT